MDWSLCDSRILLALYLTDSEQLTANPGAFSLSAPTQRFFSIKVCCAVAVSSMCALLYQSTVASCQRKRISWLSHQSCSSSAIHKEPPQRHKTPNTPPPRQIRFFFTFLCDLLHVLSSHTDSHVCAGWQSMYVFCTFSPCPKFSFLTSLSVFQFILVPLPPDFVSLRDWLVSA